MHGKTFSTTGSAVVDCYKPEAGISHLKEYSSKANETGAMPYINCEIESQTINANNAKTFEVVTPAVFESSWGMSRHGKCGLYRQETRPKRATDGDPDTKWSCRGYIQMKFDLEKARTIDQSKLF